VATKIVTGEAFAASGTLALVLAAALLAAPPPVVADGVGFDLGGRPQPGAEVRRRLAATPAVLVHALCYTGNVVALVLGRESEDAVGTLRGRESA